MKKDHLLKRQELLGFKETFVSAISLMTRSEKRSTAIILVSTVLMSLVNLLSTTSIMPFVYLVTNDKGFSIDTSYEQFNNIINSLDNNTALVLSGIAVILVNLVKMALTLDNIYRINSFTGKLEKRMSSYLLERIVSSPIQWIAEKNMNTLRDITLNRTTEWARGCIRQILRLFGNIVFVIMALATLISASPKLGSIVVVALFIVVGGILKALRYRIKQTGEEKRISGRASLIYASEAISGGREIRINKTGSVFLDYFRLAKDSYNKAEVRFSLLNSLPRQVSELVGITGTVAFALILIFSGVPATKVSATLLLFALIILRMLPIISEIANSATYFYGQSSQIKELIEFIKDTKRFKNKRIIDNRHLLYNWKCLSFSDVSFSYDNGSRPVLESLSLVIKRNSKVCIVGKSGSGKSTLIDLICGLCTPSVGSITIDSHRLEDIGIDSWQEQIAYVPQSPCLIDGSLRDNVLFGLKSEFYSDDSVINALRKAGYENDIDGSNYGLDRLLGEGGCQVSGGQRQKIAIARALLRNKSILILDESTSAVDGQTVRKILDRLASIESLTLILVVHNIEHAKVCNVIHLLEGSTIVARGSYQWLMNNSEEFQKFVGSP